MNNKELIGLIIRNKRNDLDLKSLYVAKKANISAPYFSHIENGHVHADPLVLSAIYDILQIEFNNDEKWLNKKIKEIKMLHQSIYDYDIEHRNKLYEKMIHDEEKLVSSILILDYLIAKLAYNSTSYKSDECKKIINFLDCVQDRMTAEQQNFYIYYVAVYDKLEKNTIISNDIQKVWNIVLAVDKYNSWRSDLSKTEIINDKQFIEYTKNGYATTFTVTVAEPYKRWEFDMENSNMKGHWIGVFIDKGNETQIDFTENVIPKKWFMKPFVKTYLKKQQKQFVLDLKKALE